MARMADIDDTTKFLGWGQAPPRHMGDHENGYIARSVPRHHWCFLGEIVNKHVEANKTHILELRDRNGVIRTTRLFAYNRKPNARSFHIGYTVVLLYPERPDPHDNGTLTDHDFHYAQSTEIEVWMRPTELRMKLTGGKKIFPFTLDQVLGAARKARCHAVYEGEANECQVCHAPSHWHQRCNWCKCIWYCRKGPCRAIDRREGHHPQHCKVLRKMRHFLKRDWDTFHGFWKGLADADAAKVPIGRKKKWNESNEKSEDGKDAKSLLPASSDEVQAEPEASPSLSDNEEVLSLPDIV